ncbi:response regulator [Aquimarina algicola]|uniref:Response regulator n=1 Tax=Aquimarina algicola TaxID=2589995 RepID=A0A504JLB3_9FLAO|nr:response regulator [Aquimarina algicola]TPN87361.1 response regulator [Aquimarina algicola]
MKKINCILLVDDSISTNFYNRKLIEVCGVANQVHEVHNGLEALDYLKKRGNFKSSSKNKYPRPNLIFLDINMPKMDGFEFLHEYEKLNENQKSDILIAFLTTSNWEKDKIKAFENDNLIYDFIEKPLQKETLLSIYNYYISEPKYAEYCVE